jgi:hypothetical protein
LLAAASADAPIYIWDVYGRSKPPPALSGEGVWESLGGEASQAFLTIRWLLAHPNESTDLLGRQLKPTPRWDTAPVERWLKDLADPKFTVRETASAELAKRADIIEDRLRKEIAASAGEARRRLKALVDRLDKPTAEELRRSRALEVLEQIDSDDARRLLKDLAKGEPAARFTLEARDTLRRMERP